jgi:hypothetical protein
MKKVFPYVLILMAIVFPGRSALGDASGKWTYYSFNRWNNGGLMNIRGAGTLTITQTGSSVELVNDTYEKTYTGSVSSGIYTVSSSYPFSGGTKTEVITFVLDSNEHGSGNSSWTWSDGVDSCAGGYSITFTKHQTPGTCHVDYGVEYCCHVEAGVEYCCHVDSHQIWKPSAGTPELEHCCHMELHTTPVGDVPIEHCTYVVNGSPYEYYEILDNGLNICYYLNFLGTLMWMCEIRAPIANSGALSGEVTTADGKEITTHITTYFSSGEKYKATDTKGSGPTKIYLIGSLEPTQYFIHAHAEGYETQIESLSLNPGQEAVCNFTLVPSPPELKAMPWLLPLLLGD